MTGGVKNHAREVATRWVGGELGTTVDGMRVTRSAYASSATILNVHLKLAGGERMRVVYKHGGPDGRLAAARGAKPGVVADDGREAWMYESVLASDGVAGAPRLLSSGQATGGGRWLLMEWVGSVDLGQVGAVSVWSEAASQLARLHVWGESRVGELLRGSAVRWDDPELHMLWASRARRRGDRLAALWRSYHVVAERIAAMPKTLVHGDLNASNVLVTRGPSGTRVRIIDWETAGVGPGLLDLASLTSGTLPRRHREAMLAAYRASLGAGPLSATSARHFEEALCWCRLALAVRWLGWSPTWKPPRAHEQDWRHEAVTMARQLGLVGRR